MDDVVEGIRQMTLPSSDGNGYLPPTTVTIQLFMSTLWPEKYDSNVADAKGWRNSVNQCLTHGQGINFLTYSVDGKNKRHLLFERAFNGVCVLGSGQCKALNDMAKAAKKSQAPSPPIPIASAAAAAVQQPAQYTSSAPIPSPPIRDPSTSSGMSSRIVSTSDLNPIPLSQIPLSELETEFGMRGREEGYGMDLFQLMQSSNYR